MRRGAFVVVAVSGDYGKLRPALVVQDQAFETLSSIVLCPITTHIRTDNDVRIMVQPNEANGLRSLSQVAVDKITALPRQRIGAVIGQAYEDLMAQVSRSLALLLRLG